jgi:hypothetical protein
MPRRTSKTARPVRTLAQFEKIYLPEYYKRKLEQEAEKRPERVRPAIIKEVTPDWSSEVGAPGE